MSTSLDLTTFKASSFDCYGTLIDWEAGISAVLVPWAAEQDLALGEEDLLLAYADQEAAVERDTRPPYTRRSSPRRSAAPAPRSERRSATSGPPGSADPCLTGPRSPTPPMRWPGSPGTIS